LCCSLFLHWHLRATIEIGLSTLYLKTHTKFETVSLEITRIDFDEIWQKYSETLQLNFACFIFCSFAFYQLFKSFKLDNKNNAVGLSSKRANFNWRAAFFKIM